MLGHMSRLLCNAALLLAGVLTSTAPAAAQTDDDFFKEANLASTDKKPSATDDLITFAVKVEPAEARRGQTVRLTISGTPKSGHWAYPLTVRAAGQDAAFLLRDLIFSDAPGIKPLWPITESDPQAVFEPAEKTDFLKHKQPFTWSRDLLILPDAKPGKHAITIKTKGLQICNERKCTIGEQEVDTVVTVSDAPAVPLTPELEKRLKDPKPAIKVVGGETKPPAGVSPDSKEKAAPPAPTPEPKRDKPAEEGVKLYPITESAAAYKGSMEAIQKRIQTTETPPTGLLAFMLQGVFWGAVSLVTPCVFPMIPITVSYFLKQSEKKNHRPVTMAVVYCATIVIVLTISAITLLWFFRSLSVNPIMNFALGALFVFFALSLFGMYDIELPSALTRYTSAGEGKGGLIGVMFMALTFTIVSFACVAPFLGGFGGTAGGAAITWTHRILGGLAFSTTFAAPFFVLALFPSLLRKMPKSGSWLNSVKVVMGFLELAAALKFFRAGELVKTPDPQFFTYDLVMGAWIAIAILCGLYLLNVFRLPHDSPADSIGVVRMLFGLAFVSLGLYLLPALFRYAPDGQKQRPRGAVYAWIDSFLLPEASESKGALPFTGNLAQALEDAQTFARKTGQSKLVFVDFTGKTCTNCKINEDNVFTRSEIESLFRPYNLVQLYTDVVPDKFYSSEVSNRFRGGAERQQEDALTNLAFQREAFGTEQLPLYVILRPHADGRIEVVDRYDEGKINDVNAFAQFLRKPYEEMGARVQVDFSGM
jgi:thiol:disulfide interchange protein DsbD